MGQVVVKLVKERLCPRCNSDRYYTEAYIDSGTPREERILTKCLTCGFVQEETLHFTNDGDHILSVKEGSSCLKA